jgi:YD repeat-containing protein
LSYDADAGLYTRHYPDGREIHFDDQGYHAYTLEPDGRQTVYTYTSAPFSSTNPAGAVITMAVVAPGAEEPDWAWTFSYEDDKLARIDDPAGRAITFTVDGNGHLSEVAFPGGSSRRFYYDARGLMTQQVDEGGHASGYVYDEYGRLVEHVDPARAVYDPESGQTAVTRTVQAFTPSDTGYALINDSAVGDPDDPAPAVPTSTLLVDGVTYGRGERSGHTNKWGRLLDETDGLDRTTSYEYDAADNLTGLTWPVGNCVETEYDEMGNPLSAARMGASQCAVPPYMRDSTQVQTVTFTYEPRFNQAKTQTDPLGHTTVYTYDYELGLGEEGKLVRIAYPAVRDEDGITVTPVVSYTYTGLGLLATETDVRGTVTYYTYTQGTQDEADDGENENPLFLPGVTPVPGLLTQVIKDYGGIAQTTTYKGFDAQGNATTVIGPGGDVIQYAYDAWGRVVSSTTPVGIVTLSEYDERGNLVRQVADYTADGVTGRNLVTEYTYDAAGQLVEKQTTAGVQVVQTSSSYDVNGKLALQQDSGGSQTVYAYDDADQYDYQVAPTGQVLTYTYDQNGRLEATLNADGTTTRKEYDGYGYAIRTVTNWDDGVFDPAEPEKDVETRFVYDLAGNTIVVTDTLGRATRTWYDARNRALGRIVNWDGQATLDDCATLPSVRDENVCTLYAYDLAGSTVVVTDTLGRMTRTFYDALGRVEARVTNWNPATLTSPQDCVLSPTNESDENVCTLYGYDEAGNQITTTNALDQTSLTVYDAANRPTIRVANWDGTPITQTAHCSFPPAQPDTNLCTVTGYDARGQRSSTQDPLGHVTEFGYDAQGRLITTTRYLDGEPVVTVNHYDTLGSRVGQTDARGHTTTYVYDYLGRLEASISAEGVAHTQGYDEYGRVVTTTDGLGGETITGYDMLGRRATVTDPEGYVTAYAYDGLGNQVQITDPKSPSTNTMI